MPADPVAPLSDGAFAVGRRGYDPQQVDTHLRRTEAEIRILVADRDAAVDQAAQLGRELDDARLRADRLRTQVRTMAARPSDVQGMSERIRTMLRLAEDEVADMLRRADAEVARRLGEADANTQQVVDTARREATQIRDAAQAQAHEVTAAAGRRLAETEAACAAQRQAADDERTAAAQAIADVTQRADRERARVRAESETRRAEVEEDFSIAMDQRRTEALAEMHAERLRTAEWVEHSRTETTRQCRAELARAEETAQQIVAAAQDRVAQLADLRGRIAAQLHGTQAQLDDTLTALAAVEPPEALPVDARATPEPHVPEPPVPASAEQSPAPPAPPAAAAARPPAPTRDRAVPDVEPTTRPLPIATPPSGTLVLEAPAPDAPAGAPSPDGSTAARPAHPGSTDRSGGSRATSALAVPAPAVASQVVSPQPPDPAPVQPVPDEAPDAGPGDARRPTQRRRKRRPATGATRR